MKTRFLAVMLAITLLAAASACGGSEDSGDRPDAQSGISDSVPASEPAAQDDEKMGQFQTTAVLDETVLVEENGVKITATGLSYTGYSADLQLIIENNSGKDLSFTSGSLGYNCNSINGYMVDSGYLNCDVADGKKANEVMQFSCDSLMIYGIYEIADMEIGFAVTDEDYNSIYTGPRALRTSAADTHVYDADSYRETITSTAAMNAYGYEAVSFGQGPAYDQNGVKLLSSGILRNTDGETALLLELENTTDSMVYVSVSDIKINDLVASSSVWSSSAINPGKRRVAEVELSSVLDGGFWDTYGIAEVGTVSVSLEQYNGEGTEIASKTPVEVTVPGVSAAFDAQGTEVYSDNGLQIVFKAIQQDDSDLSGDVYLLLLAENNSGRTLAVSDVYGSLSVNGFMTDYSLYGQEMENGESAALVIRLWGSSLEENRIASASEVQEVEVKLDIRQEYTTLDEPSITLTPGA